MINATKYVIWLFVSLLMPICTQLRNQFIYMCVLMCTLPVTQRLLPGVSVWSSTSFSPSCFENFWLNLLLGSIRALDKELRIVVSKKTIYPPEALACYLLSTLIAWGTDLLVARAWSWPAYPMDLWAPEPWRVKSQSLVLNLKKPTFYYLSFPSHTSLQLVQVN